MLTVDQARLKSMESSSVLSKGLRDQEGYRSIYEHLEKEIEAKSSKGEYTAETYTTDSIISKRELDQLVSDLACKGYMVTILRWLSGKRKIEVNWN
jgi:hypothetical protein